MTAADRLILRLDEVVINASVGIYPWEKFPEHPNRLKISIELHAKLPSGPLASHPIIDYAQIYKYLQTIPSLGHIDLLETLVDQITEQCFAIPQVEAVRIKILKTSLLPDCKGAGIDVFRSRENWPKVGK